MWQYEKEPFWSDKIVTTITQPTWKNGNGQKEAKSGEAVTPLEASHEKEKSETPIEYTDKHEFDSEKKTQIAWSIFKKEWLRPHDWQYQLPSWIGWRRYKTSDMRSNSLNYGQVGEDRWTTNNRLVLSQLLWYIQPMHRNDTTKFNTMSIHLPTDRLLSAV